MGQLRDKKISYTRTWIDPTNPNPIPVFDYDIIYPITVYEAIHRTMDDDSTTLESELAAIYRLIADKQDKITGGTPGTLMTWSNIKGQIGETEIVKTIGDGPGSRSNSKVPTENAVGQKLDLKADASAFNNHRNNSIIHVTEEEREAWDRMTPIGSFNDHRNDEDIHITAEERDSWNARANKDAFDAHVNDTNNPHNVTAHQIGTYSRSEVDDMFQNIRESFFSYRNIEYDYGTNTAELVEYQSDNWNPNYVLSYGDELPEVTDTSLTYFAIKPVTDYSTNETQECQIYIKKPAYDWQEVGVQTMSPGDMVIRYPDTTMCVWVQGRFIKLFTSSSAAGNGGGTVSENNMMWRPIITAEGVLTWTKSDESNAPDPITIKGEAGDTPKKGKDYFDGAPGIGVPSGGTAGDIIVKTTGEDYDTEWMSLSEFINEYIGTGGASLGSSNWDDIKNRPEIYDELGDDSDGLMSQKAITDQFNAVSSRIDGIDDQLGSSVGLSAIRTELDAHIKNNSNPHNISVDSIGAVSNGAFKAHSQNFDNPHSVTASQIGLGNVNNTSDLEKPMSVATKNAVNELNSKIDEINGVINAGTLISNVVWDNEHCKLTFTFRDASELDIEIPILDIFKTIYYDDVNHELVILLPDGSEHRISIEYLITVYTGGTGRFINVTIENGVIKAEPVPGSFTGEELVESIHLRNSPTTTTQLVSDNSDKIATTRFVKQSTIDRLDSYDLERPLSANMGRILNQNKADTADVLQIIADTPLMNVIDTLTSHDSYSALSANMGRELNLTKAPWVHTSPSSSTYGRATVDLFGHVRATSLDPLMDGIAAVGTDDGYYSRADHRHPTDVSRAPVNFPDTASGITKLTGTPKAVTPADDSNDERIATTEWVRRNVGSFVGGSALQATTPPDSSNDNYVATTEWVRRNCVTNDDFSIIEDAQVSTIVASAFSRVVS